MDRKWLVTIAPEKVTDVTASLKRLGCRVGSEAAVPVDGDSVLSVSGPDALEQELARVPGVKAVHPDSDMSLY